MNFTLSKILATVAKWNWPEGPFQWAKPEKKTSRAERRRKDAPKKEREWVQYELHMGPQDLQDPRGKWHRHPASGLIFRDIVPVNLDPSQGDMFSDAVALLPDIKNAFATLHMMLEVSSRLLAQVDQSPSSDWSSECDALRAQIKSLQDDMPKLVEEVPAPELVVASR